jgi:hypothetical protein
MKTKLILGISCVLALGLAACSDSSDGEADASAPIGTPDTGIQVIDTRPADVMPTPVDTAAPEEYLWVVVQDTEQKACTTNGPGADIDAVALWDLQTSTAIGWGKLNTATFTPNPAGNACDNVDCSGANCKYAYISNTFDGDTLVSWTEGPRDGAVLAVDDYGYFALNGGTLQIQIGDAVAGTGPAKVLTSGDLIRVFEVDKTYIADGSAPASCLCLPERYTVSLQTNTGKTLPLRPMQLAAGNTTCAALTTTSVEGCGTTLFMVP